ncbi:hypothetical protein DJ480_11925 [Pseudomonas sp. Leaf98]|nr:hypothetical protein DJ480_11925 [Pseudomonas sp. Leaf98]
MRGNASCDALRHGFKSGRRASRTAFPRGAWERSKKPSHLHRSRLQMLLMTKPRSLQRLQIMIPRHQPHHFDARR